MMKWWLRVSSVHYRIVYIFLMGSIPKVSNVVVQRIAVNVQRFHSFGSWAYKCFKDQEVYWPIIGLSVFTQCNFSSIVGGLTGQALYIALEYSPVDFASGSFSWRNRAYSPKRRDLIIFKPYNRTPQLHG